MVGGYCSAALRLLRAKGIAFEQIDVDGDAKMRRWLIEQTGRTTVPQIFIDGQPIGGFTDLRELEQHGTLDAMLKGRGDATAATAG